MRTLIIAEAGVNHNGNVKIATEMIDVAASAGADYIKFQTFNANHLAVPSASKAAYQAETSGYDETQYDMLKRLELTPDMHRILLDYCNKREIGFLSTAFDIPSVDFLYRLGQRLFKIPSGEITNIPYLRHLGEVCDDIIISTGMSSLGEIETALDVLEKAGTTRNRITVLHCTTEYPAPFHDVNLRAMQTIRDAFDVKVGYSDHTLGIEIAIAAVALGAQVIEKHFTLSRNLPGPDQLASLEPNELVAMISAIRNVDISKGDGLKRVTIGEVGNREVIRKSIVASRAIKTGEKFCPSNLSTKRPGTGISPIFWDEILNRCATRDYSPDDEIEW